MSQDLFHVKWVDDVPEIKDIKGYTIYVMKDFWAMFYCPCGCGDIIQISIQKDTKHPKWVLVVDDADVPTITPSIQRKSHCACKSHFFVTKGLIKWA